jgi:hypothetical protein
MSECCHRFDLQALQIDHTEKGRVRERKNVSIDAHHNGQCIQRERGKEFGSTYRILTARPAAALNLSTTMIGFVTSKVAIYLE